jgi:hypothetical protein
MARDLIGTWTSPFNRSGNPVETSLICVFPSTVVRVNPVAGAARTVVETACELQKSLHFDPI